MGADRAVGSLVRIVCSYCSAAKRDDEAALPALERYRSERLGRLARQADRGDAPLFILSGRFGLLAAGDPIPWYDHLLGADEAPALAQRVARRLRELGVTEVEYHTAAPAAVAPIRPYLETMRAACAESGAALTIVELAGDPA